MMTTDLSSDADDECIHGLGPLSACVICNGSDRRDKLNEQANSRLKYTFKAKFDGTCRKCFSPTSRGELVGMTQDDQVICSACFITNDPGAQWWKP